MSKKSSKPIDLDDDDMMGEIPVKETAPKTPEAPAEEPLLDFPDRKVLESKLTETEKKLATAEERVVRVLADIENVRRRAQKDVEAAHRYGNIDIVEKLIPVLDSLEEGSKVDDQAHELVKSMREGMLLTLEMFKKVLTKFGLQEIHPLHQPFNPALHEVMMAQPSNDVAPNTVVTVLQKGYQLHDRVIRPARVIVAKALPT